METSKNLGKYAEEFAYRYLKKKGLCLVVRNYTCRFGEIDLIMKDKNVLVFIEVRYRRNKNFCKALETIDFYKQTKIINTAEHYLQYNRIFIEHSCRFDVLGISSKISNKLSKFSSSLPYSAEVEWVKNAFFR